MLGRISLGTVGLVVGGTLTIVGFIAYFASSATLNLVGFFYGIPLLLGGLALKISELTPVPYSEPPSEAILALREQQATDTQHQIRKDVTRYRYGQSAHLDSSLESLGLEPTDDERPVLVALREEAREGAYALVLEFESEYISLDKWNSKREKIERFFGPGLRVEISQPGEDYVDVALISTGTEQASPS
ncbi:MAG: DUF2854 domain-containing protein [Cyanobacteria bacterium J069]|nr:MAG: DUF2854 domain-containing protein [Cyanobacteria bacterium J069]